MEPNDFVEETVRTFMIENVITEPHVVIVLEFFSKLLLSCGSEFLSYY